jgi:hypothetical protein
MLKEKSLIMITFSSVLTNRVHDIGLCFCNLAIVCLLPCERTVSDVRVIITVNWTP